MVATVLTALVVLYQNHILEESLREMRQQSASATKSADAAEAAAKATEDQLPVQIRQLDLTRESMKAANDAVSDQLAAQREAMRLERRAWIGPVRMGLTEVAADKPLRVEVHLLNTGETPAREVQVQGALRIAAEGQLPTFTYDPPSRPPSRLVVQPQMTVIMPFNSRGNIQSGAFPLLNSGAQVIFMYGLVQYRDVFDRPHATRFCAFFNPDLKTIRWCNTYNDAD
jgi:hypothetical protein